MQSASRDPLDRFPVTGRYWATIALHTLNGILEFFDFFIVGFLVAVLAPQWKLIFGQTSLMLLSAGIGAMVGSLTGGVLADRYGRKPFAVLGVLICGFSSGLIAFIPDDGWIHFTVLRFLVGFGLSFGAAAALPALIEFSPTRYRTLVSSLVVVPITFGILAASIVAAVLLPVVGWRGVAAIGFAPIIVGFLTLLIMPESPRWLASKGRRAEAGISVRKLYRIEDSSFQLPTPVSARPTRTADLFARPGRVWLTVLTFFGASTAHYDVFLWGPTILAILLGVEPHAAAKMFIAVSLAGVLGRIGFSFLAQRFGRRACGQVMGYASAAMLGLAAFSIGVVVADVPLFLICLVVGAIFFDGGFANLAPYPAEIFPVQLSGRAVGLSQFANGVGKIAGPLCLALIAGTSNIVAPRATMEAIVPAFLFLASCSLLVGLAFTFARRRVARAPRYDPRQYSGQECDTRRDNGKDGRVTGVRDMDCKPGNPR